jgi:hypothetical protein
MSNKIDNFYKMIHTQIGDAHMFTFHAVVLPTPSSLMNMPLQYWLIESVIALQYMYLESFIHQSSMSPQKNPRQELKMKMCCFNSVLCFCQSLPQVTSILHSLRLLDNRQCTVFESKFKHQSYNSKSITVI